MDAVANDNAPLDAFVPPVGGGRLSENLTYFARALRTAGVPVGPAQVVDAVRALELGGIGHKSDFYWTLHTVFVRRHEHSELFFQAFDLFWRKRGLVDKMMAMLMPSNAPRADQPKPPSANRRVADAMFQNIENTEPRRKPKVDIDARLTASDDDVVRHKDFEQMSAAEVLRAKAIIRALRPVFSPVETRRHKASVRGRSVDLRRTLKASVRAGGDAIVLKHRAPKARIPPLVAICDISGSMSQYSRLFLHFLHALTDDQKRVHTFLFGTHLSNVTRHLRQKDVDAALSSCSGSVSDWSGGTRISASLERFNKDWSRRVLGQGATVLLMTDGLERDHDGRLEAETERLAKSCGRLVWLNPLLRFDGFEARAHGIRAMLPHVDAFRPIHNLESMEDLVEALARPQRRMGVNPVAKRLLATAASANAGG
ncbi:MAG: VWA domain-containing protein [Pseudomonadota bacterium]